MRRLLGRLLPRVVRAWKEETMRRFFLTADISIDGVSMMSAQRPNCSPEQLARALDVQNVQYGTVGRRPAGAFGHGACQQAFEFLQVAELGSDVFEMVCGNLADLTTRCLGW